MSTCDCNQGRLPCSCKSPLTGDGDDTAEFQLNAAQSELAALREELDALKNHCADLDGVNGIIKKARDAAEQRNAALLDVIRMTLHNSSEDAQTGEIGIERGDYDELCSLIKPTESGASE